MRDDEQMNHEELQDPNTWEFAAAERRTGRGGRAVVSVAFQREDYERVVAWAEQVGKRTSEFIREAAVEQATRQTKMASVTSFTGSLGSYALTERPLVSTRAPRAASGDVPEAVTA